MADETRLAYYKRRQAALEQDRSSFTPHWRELSQFVLPRMGRYFTGDVNRGDKRYQSIINSRGTQSHRTCRAGIFNGIMSPSRPWFKLMTPDDDMMLYQPVQDWLFRVEKLMAAVFAASNLYNMAPVTIGELLLFASGCMTQEDDFQKVTRFYAQTAGSYWWGQNEKFIVDTLMRRFQMSVRQMVGKFSLGNVSATIRSAYDQGNYEARFDVVHFVEPNITADARKLESRFKPFSSVYYEAAARENDKLLSDMGFDEFPAHCPRWDVTGEDTYGTDCPGMTTLGDVKGLQDLERDRARAITKMQSPPMGGPPSLRNIPINSLPGGATIYDGSGGQKVEPLYTVNPNIRDLMLNIQHHEKRIEDGYYVDLFRSIASKEGVQPENRLFLTMMQTETLQQLGPVLERLHGEFLNSVVDRTFARLTRIPGLLPPAPPEMQGQPLRVRYISSLAMAMREVETQGIDKFTMFIAGLMKAGFTAAGDVYDADEGARSYGLAVGVSPKLLVSQDRVAAIRAHREQEQQQQQKTALALQMAQAAQAGGAAVNSMATAPTASGGSALDNMGAAAAPR